MKIYWGTFFVGRIEANEYTVRELEAAGFRVVIE